MKKIRTDLFSFFSRVKNWSGWAVVREAVFNLWFALWAILMVWGWALSFPPIGPTKNGPTIVGIAFGIFIIPPSIFILGVLAVKLVRGGISLVHKLAQK